MGTGGSKPGEGVDPAVSGFIRSLHRELEGINVDADVTRLPAPGGGEKFLITIGEVHRSDGEEGLGGVYKIMRDFSSEANPVLFMIEVAPGFSKGAERMDPSGHIVRTTLDDDALDKDEIDALHRMVEKFPERKTAPAQFRDEEIRKVDTDCGPKPGFELFHSEVRTSILRDAVNTEFPSGIAEAMGKGQEYLGIIVASGIDVAVKAFDTLELMRAPQPLWNQIRYLVTQMEALKAVIAPKENSGALQEAIKEYMEIALLKVEVVTNLARILRARHKIVVYFYGSDHTSYMNGFLQFAMGPLKSVKIRSIVEPAPDVGAGPEPESETAAPVLV